MAKSENKNPTGGQTELVTPGTGSTTPPSDVDAKLAEVRAAEQKLAEERRKLDEDRRKQTAELEQQRRRQEEDLEQQRRNQEETAQQLRAGAEELERRQTEMAMMASAPQTGPSDSPQAGDTRPFVRVRNNSVRAINIGGATLIPGVGQVPLDAWQRLFDRHGNPVPGAQEHFDTSGGKRPDLQALNLENLSMLPEDDAVDVVKDATNTDLLAKFSDTDPRASVKKAIRERLKALQS